VRLPAAAAAFGGFASPALRREFEAWLEKVATSWCCRLEADAARLGLPSKHRLRITGA
jgi:hypothetical protein